MNVTCPHRPPCPGCPRLGQHGIATLAHDALNELARKHGLDEVPVTVGHSTGFRSRARLAIRGRGRAPKVGLFEHGTHRVVHIPSCQVQHPLINHIARTVRQCLADSHVTCYSDSAHLGLARYLQVVIESRSQAAQVILVANSATSEPLAPCLELLRERLGADLHSLWFNSNTSTGNTILGSSFERWCGADSVVEHFGGAAIHYPPGAFGQSNLPIAQMIIEHIRGLLPPNAAVAEFYAGVGAIGLSILDGTSKLQMNEVSPASLQGLQSGIAALNAADQAKVSIAEGPAESTLHLIDEAQVVIADPPRRGLDRLLLDRLCEWPPRRFIYVSCGVQSFTADAERLTAGGAMRLVSLAAFDLMPFTEHVETVACFESTRI